MPRADTIQSFVVRAVAVAFEYLSVLRIRPWNPDVCSTGQPCIQKPHSIVRPMSAVIPRPARLRVGSVVSSVEAPSPGGGRVGYTLIDDVSERIDILEDGTLSRVLHRDDKVRLVAFGFDAGQELTEHTAAVPVLLQVVSGRVEMSVGDDSFELAPRGWLRMDARLPHSVLALEPTVLLLTMLPD